MSLPRPRFDSTLRPLLGVTMLVVAVLAAAAPSLTRALPAGDPTVPAERDTEPVILSGAQFADWAVPANVTAKLPVTDFFDAGVCALDGDRCDQHDPEIEGIDFGALDPVICAADPTQCDNLHNHYGKPLVDTAPVSGEGTPVDRLLGYRWDSQRSRFVQIPFQVDEMFTRYLNNSASGFAFFSGEDQHTSYAFDREGFRFTESDSDDPCLARPKQGVATTPDPVPGLDTNDELVFMASDAGPPAPADAPLPRGIEQMRRVEIIDPSAPGATARVAYVAKADADGPRSAFDEKSGYVRYTRDKNADLFEKSESSYEGYGNAERGIVCDAEGNVLRNPDGTPRIERRRPRDYATVETDRYRFRYDGRWLMTKLEISPDGGKTFGPDLVDRWKARAFQQDPSSETPCCGYEEEDTNWGGSSTLLGERSGPVRTIRETWGADSGTNVVRREVFYRDEMRQKTFLRVHVIPPLDGIYAQWDFNAGRMTRYYNSAMQPTRPEGVAVDGRNDEVFGNLDDPCNPLYDPETNANGTSELDQAYRTVYEAVPGLCSPFLGQEDLQLPYHQSIDVPDFTASELNAAMQWNVTAGPHGTVVDRYQIDKLTEQSAGGLAQSVLAVPYYRDDSCFDDGTGTDPGPRVRLRSSSEPRTYTAADGSQQARKCWQPADGLPDGSERYFQGDIATHGLHILLIADSDNARQQVPLTEMVAEQRMVMLPGERDGSVGEQYGRGFEKPLVTLVLPEQRAQNKPPTASFEFAPSPVYTGVETTFTSTSTDEDGQIDQVAWDLDGDGEFDDAEGDTATRTFTATGTHTVAMRATDSSGASATDEASIEVTNPAPTASIDYTPATPRSGQTVTFTATASDANGTIASYAWDLDADGQYDDGNAATVRRSFTKPGSYRVEVRVTDNEGAMAVAAAVVEVGNGRPRR